MANNFQIKLSGAIDLKSVNTSLSGIEKKLAPLKLQIDTAYIQKQLNSLHINVGTNVSGRDTSIAKSALGAGQTTPLQEQINKLTGATSSGRYTEKDLLKEKDIINMRTKAMKEQIHTQEVLATQTANYESRLKSLANSGALTSKEFTSFTSQLSTLKSKLDKGEISTSDFKKQFDSLKRSTSETASEMMTFGERTKSALSAMTEWMLATTIFFAVVRAIKQMITQVIALDKAFTNLQIVTKYTNQQMKELRQTYIDVAKSMGVTLDALVSGADEWLRAGLSVKDTMEGLKASTVLSTVAQMDSATATQYLIAQMNAYNLAANELINIVDKMSAVDVVAATSSAELGEAISLTAKSAQLAGIEYDKLLGMIATVSETTRQSASSIGNSFKTILSRLQAVKIGSLVDEEGESVSDVATVMKEYGIDIMEVTDNLNNMGALLDLLGSKWDSYTTAQKSEIATTVAGIRQREKFIVLMDEYDRALELEKVSLDSAGSAMEKYSVYQDSVEAKINTLKTSLTELYNTTLNSGVVKFVIDILNGVLNLATAVGGLVPILGTVLGLVIALKATQITRAIGNAINGISTLFKTITTGIVSVQSAMGVIGLAIAALSAVVMGINAIVNAVKENEKYLAQVRAERIAKIEEEIATQEKLKAEYVSLAYTENKTETQKTRLKELTALLNIEYEKELGLVQKMNGEYEVSSETYAQFIQKKIDDNKKLLDSMRYDYMQAQKKSQKIGTDVIGGDASSILEGLSETAKGHVRADTRSGYSNIFVTGTMEERLASYKEIENLLYERQEKMGKLTKGEQAALADAHKQMAKLEESITSTNDALTKYKELMSETEFYEESKADIAELSQAMDKFNHSTLEEQATQYEKIDGLIANLKKISPDYIDLIDQMTSAYKEQSKTLKTTDFALKLLGKNLSALKEMQKIEEDELKTKEKLLAVEKAREELAKAKDKRILAYRVGKGMVEVQDTSAIQEAQENLNEAAQAIEGTKTEQAIKQIEELQSIYDQAIKDQGKVSIGGKEVGAREAFLNQDFLASWSKMSLAERKAVLEQFLATGSWETTQAKLKQEQLDELSQWIPKHANGTLSAQGGISLVGEKGAELRVLNKGDGVIDSNTTKNLIAIGKNPSQFLKAKAQSSQSSESWNFGTVILQGVQDMDSFVNEIKRKANPRKPRMA